MTIGTRPPPPPPSPPPLLLSREAEEQQGGARRGYWLGDGPAREIWGAGKLGSRSCEASEHGKAAPAGPVRTEGIGGRGR